MWRSLTQEMLAQETRRREAAEKELTDLRAQLGMPS
jgi:hypothetical protein